MQMMFIIEITVIISDDSKSFFAFPVDSLPQNISQSTSLYIFNENYQTN